MTLTLASALVLTGCTAPPPQTVAVSSPTVAPVFASDEEALAAAVEAYEKYLAVSDQIAQEGGAGADRFEDVVTDEWLASERHSAEVLASSGLRQVGTTTFNGMRLQQMQHSDQLTSVVTYACLDLAGVEFVDSATGSNAVRPKVLMVPVEVSFQTSDANPRSLVVGGNGPWSNVNLC